MMLPLHRSPVVADDAAVVLLSWCREKDKNLFIHLRIVRVRLQVWDIGGQSIAGEMIDKYIYGSHAALIVYDVTNLNSFDNCQDWLNVIRRVTKSQEKVLYCEILVFLH
ncbi:hypothetical protein ANCDUO_14125 [Ancylostoma duodenale]|uniref:Ras family protein n=1 Tax=Ancylostoma duodenale TaxID=51022 RepID=A0A0C2D0Z9_9BILA|nr:hypothetical protein ANCDUO_14125 [Ancylostoma duodenale]